MSTLPAWYGKLPGLGDFASRRIEPDFLEFWDNWLAEGMLALRERDPIAWLDAYLVSPTWRFLLMPACLPGALGEQAWAGVLMPSVDKVGRYFPFTIVRRLAQPPGSLQGLQALWQELGQLDDLAADALQDDWSAERMESELASLKPPSSVENARALAESDLPLLAGELSASSSGLDAAGQIVAEALQLWGPQARGRSYWYAAAAPSPGNLRLCSGLPRSSSSLLCEAKANQAL
ncbi:type VI secretion system-associated protein TagF [Paucibacter sp. B2R-40]|uniref:type VI secretion system-associated protein TagF n=1 Tax=Paucibacter sp. B2R-40 TaxID=2893554 RepID=UPI0021E41DBC|nr:type VI secretion system-associated protein TagF [Paucibacter sp. B2R-40]MCV2355953.1 type VI secretion system-associated protein TagF [Paucibacter sp. B2R-40]